MNIDTLRAERDQLEHQAQRLEEILAQSMVSPMMMQNLRQRLIDISDRVSQLSVLLRLPDSESSTFPGQRGHPQ